MRNCLQKKEAKCSAGSNTRCRCKHCFGRFCNHSPVYKAGAAQLNLISAPLTALAILDKLLGLLVRLGVMFDLGAWFGLWDVVPDIPRSSNFFTGYQIYSDMDGFS